MSQEVALGLLISVLVLVVLCCIVTLVFVVRLFIMHNVRNADGQYAWMMPTKWFDAQERISESQERIAGSLADLSANNTKVAKLMQSLVDATLCMHQEMIKARQDEGK